MDKGERDEECEKVGGIDAIQETREGWWEPGRRWTGEEECPGRENHNLGRQAEAAVAVVGAAIGKNAAAALFGLHLRVCFTPNCP